MTLRYLILLPTLFLAACAATPRGKFQCPTPDGVACMGVQDLYAATHDADRVVGRTQPADARGSEHSAEPLVFRARSTRSRSNYAPAQLPVRQPAKVMRIWLAPWEDDQGDLVMASYVYSEIETSKWSVGNKPTDTVTAGTYTYRLDPPTPSDDDGATKR